MLPYVLFSLQGSLLLFIVNTVKYVITVAILGTYIGHVNTTMQYKDRPLCKECKSKPRAYAYKRYGKIYWRSLCDTCIRKSAGKKVGGVTVLQRSGYKIKKKCELCGFKAQDKSQLDVLFVDGDLRNTSTNNLKTVCANCQRLRSTRRLGWRVGDLVADD